MAWPGARRTYEQEAACEPGRLVADHYNIGVDLIGGVRPGFVRTIQSLPPLSDPVSSPLPVSSDPAVGLLTVNGAPVPPAAIGAGQQTGYISPFADADSAVGNFAVDLFAVGYSKPYHVRLEVELRSLDPGGPLYPVLVEVPG